MIVKRTFSLSKELDSLVENVVRHTYIETDEHISYSEALRRIILSSSLVSDCRFLEEGVELEVG